MLKIALEAKMYGKKCSKHLQSEILQDMTTGSERGHDKNYVWQNQTKFAFFVDVCKCLSVFDYFLRKPYKQWKHVDKTKMLHLEPYYVSYVWLGIVVFSCHVGQSLKFFEKHLSLSTANHEDDTWKLLTNKSFRKISVMARHSWLMYLTIFLEIKVQISAQKIFSYSVCVAFEFISVGW